MKKIIILFLFIPFIKRAYIRKYYATGLGTYIVNSFFKVILGINKGNFLFHFTSRVNQSNNIKINGKNKENVYLSFASSGGCYYQAINGIEIGEGTLWSCNCSFISANHSEGNLKEHIKVNPIKVGKNVWIGANCVILPGVEIGDNAIVGAGSVVTKNVIENSIVAGVPAKLIKMKNVTYES